MKLLYSKILGSEGLTSVSFLGAGESPRVGDTLLRPGGDETSGPVWGHHGQVMITLGFEGRRS